MEWLRGRSHSETILIVDDDPDCRETLADILRAEGYRVSCAANGQEALDHLQTHSQPELILLDLIMPSMNGWEFRRRQQADPALAAIPVVVVSALGSTREEVSSVDAVAYLMKPFSLENLLHTVGRCCRGPAAGARGSGRRPRGRPTRPPQPARPPDEPAGQRASGKARRRLGERRDEAA